jgi:hypothetical protein
MIAMQEHSLGAYREAKVPRSRQARQGGGVLEARQGT